MVNSCIPVVPSKDIGKSLRFWIDGLGFEISQDSEMREGGKLIFCMIHKADMNFMLGSTGVRQTSAKPESA